MKLGEVVVIHVYYTFTKFRQNWMKNQKKVLLIALFSVQNFKVSVELWISYKVWPAFEIISKTFETNRANFPKLQIFHILEHCVCSMWCAALRSRISNISLLRQFREISTLSWHVNSLKICSALSYCVYYISFSFLSIFYVFEYLLLQQNQAEHFL